MTQFDMTGIFHAYGNIPVLCDVSLAVAPGELACLLGPSGCGKTTLLRVIAGLEPIQKGRITIGGDVMADAIQGIDKPAENRGVGLMFQDFALFPHLTVRRNVTFGIAGYHDSRADWVDQALRRVGLAGYASRYPHTLSGGQQQRVALLRALAPKPRLMLLDEPFSSLDVTLRAQVRGETSDILKDSGVASVMVTHDPEEAMSMADNIFVMDQGRIVQRGAPASLYLHPVNAFVAALFGPVNRLNSCVRSACVSTPVGTFAARNLDEGTTAQVLIRHEGIKVLKNPENRQDAIPARLLSARLIGRTSRVRLRIAEGTEFATEIEARVPLAPSMTTGDLVWIAVDHDRVLVFAAT